eukprot:gene2336-4541_t
MKIVERQVSGIKVEHQERTGNDEEVSPPPECMLSSVMAERRICMKRKMTPKRCQQAGRTRKRTPRKL